MSVWAIGLIVCLAGIIVILIRRLPGAIKEVQNQDEGGVEHPVIIAQPVKSVKKEFVSKPKVSSQSRPSFFAAFTKPTVKAVVKPRNEKIEALDDEVLITRGDRAFQAKEYETARGMYEELLRREEDPKWFNRLGVINLELEQFHDAREAFRSALRFGDNVASRHANLAMAEFALGHRLTAVRYLRKAVALSPNNKRYEQLLASMEASE